MSEDKFRDQYISEACALAAECNVATGYYDVMSQGECEGFVGAFWGLAVAGCDFDRKAAKECLKSVQAMDCDLYAEDMGDGCEEVYSGADCGW